MTHKYDTQNNETKQNDGVAIIWVLAGWLVGGARGQNLQVAVIVEGLADLLGDGLVHLHDGGLVAATVTVVRRAEDRAHSLPHTHRKKNKAR